MVRGGKERVHRREYFLPIIEDGGLMEETKSRELNPEGFSIKP